MKLLSKRYSLQVLLAIFMISATAANAEQMIHAKYGDLRVTCSAESLIYNIETAELSTVINTACVEASSDINFDGLPSANVPFAVSYLGTALEFQITEGSGTTNSDITVVLADRGAVEEPTPAPAPAPSPTSGGVQDEGGNVSELNKLTSCVDHRDNGADVFNPDNCPRVTIFRGSDSRDTEVPGCIGSPTAPPLSCRSGSITGQHVYAQRFKMTDWGAAKESGGFIKSSTVDTMANDSPKYTTLIVSISPTPGDFESTPECNFIQPNSTASVRVVQAGTQYAADNPGYCALTPGVTYYFNTMPYGGETEKCGSAAECDFYTLVRTPLGK